MNLTEFRGKVHAYRKLAGYSQSELAEKLAIQQEVLSRKMSDKSPASLTHLEIKQIIKTLAQWQAITMTTEATELLELAGLPSATFSSQDWQLSPLNLLQSTPVAAPTTSKGAIGPKLLPGSTLPNPMTAFVGREIQLQQLANLFNDNQTRLVTLLGPGGMGKTRLAIRLAHSIGPTFRDGVFFVALANITNPTLVAQTVAHSLAIPETKGKSLEDSLKDYLLDKDLLLVLDNFEQVLEAASLVGEWLSLTANLKILVTSRSVLGLYGEREFVVPPLSVPDLTNLPPEPAAILEYEAIALLVARAQQYRFDFALTAENGPTLVQICVAVDGLPLALELAAVRLKIMSPQTLLQRLEEHRLNFLKGGQRDLPSRHQNLRNVLDWSYSLLTLPEQTLFRRLAVFVGGWTLEAAEQICADNRANPAHTGPITADYEVLDLLEQLVNKSLVSISLLEADTAVASRPGQERYTFLETIREYALEKLQQSEPAEPPKEHLYHLYYRHLTYYAEMAEQFAPYLSRDQAKPYLEQLEAEHYNLRVALERCANPAFAPTGQAAELFEVGVKLSLAIYQFWYLYNYYKEGREIYASLLKRVAENNITTTAHAWLLCRAGELAHMQSDNTEAQLLLNQSLAIFRTVDHKAGMGDSVFYLGHIANEQGSNETAIALYTESSDYYRQLGDKQGLGAALCMLGYIYTILGDFGTAVAHLQESIGYGREINDKAGISMNLGALGFAAYRQGQLELAAIYYSERMQYALESGDKDLLSNTYNSLSSVALAEKNYPKAIDYLEQALNLSRKIGQRRNVAGVLTNLGSVAASQENWAVAVRYSQEALQTAQAINYKTPIGIALATLGYVALRQEQYPIALQHYADSLKVLREVGDKFFQVNCLAGIGNIAVNLCLTAAPQPEPVDYLQHRAFLAITLSQVATTTLAAMNTTAKPAIQKLQAQTLEKAGQLLDNAAFVAATRQGQNTPLDTALDLILATDWKLDPAQSFLSLYRAWPQL